MPAPSLQFIFKSCAGRCWQDGEHGAVCGRRPLDLPDGQRWSFEKACEVLRERGRAEEYRIVPEVTRYYGWPGQAPSYTRPAATRYGPAG